MGKISDLYNKFESKRNAALLDAAIEKSINNLEYDVHLLESTLESLNAENIEDIELLNKKFVIVLKDDMGLYNIMGRDMPKDVDIFDSDFGPRIVINDNNPERLDEYFELLIECVKVAINANKIQIEKLKRSQTS